MKTKKGWLVLAVVVTLLANVLSGCSPADSKSSSSSGAGTGSGSSDAIVIAVAGPMTGDNAVFGEYMRRSAQLAADEINSAGGIDGRELIIRIEDDQMVAREASLVADRLSKDNTVLAVVGHFSSTTSLAAVPIYDRSGMLVISPASTSPELSGSSQWFYRTVMTDEIASRLTAEYAVEGLGAQRLAIVHSLSDATTGQAEFFQERAEELGAEVIAVFPHEDDLRDFTAIVTELRSLNPDLILIASFSPAAAQFTRQLREAGMDTQLMGTDPIYTNEFLELAGAEGNGLIANTYFHPDLPRPSVQRFVDGYKSRHGELPEAYGAGTYDAVHMLAEAIEEVGADREAIRNYLARLGKDLPAFEGVKGSYTFDDMNDPHMDIVFIQVVDGTWQLAPGN